MGALIRIVCVLFGTLAFVAPSSAQELLSNRSFETPVGPANGNNFYASIPNWTVTPDTVQPLPANVVVPWSGYPGNPTVTPAGGGLQYLDINSTSGKIRQTVVLPADGLVDFSAWFSVRDTQQALPGLTINIRNASDVVVATASTSFVLTDPIGLWKQASVSNIPLGAGTYAFEILLPDQANVDLASMVYKPPLSLTKTSSAQSDPLNGTINPKLIPGGAVEYTLTITNSGAYTVTNDSIIVSDATPGGADLLLSDIAGIGSGPVAFSAGASGLTFTYAGLASAAGDLEFSNNNGTSWTYSPSANSNGVDTAVSNVRLRPKGSMSAGSSFNVRLRYRIR